MHVSVHIALSCLIAAAGEIWANMAPVVDAGPDTTTTLSRRFTFKGSAVDDTLPNNTLTTEWTLLSGPDSGAVIANSSYYASPVVFSKTGTYLFQLTATDGALADSDSVSVTVLDSVPFLVLEPHPNDTVFIGSTYTIRWQYDPPGSAVTVALSIDGGLEYSYLPSEAVRTDHYVWTVSDTLTASGSCFIRVRDYKNLDISTYVGPFTIAEPARVRRNMLSPPVVPRNSPGNVFGISGRCLGFVHPSRTSNASVHAARGITVVQDGRSSSLVLPVEE